MATATRPGDVLGGRYRLIDLLSEAGGGRFWRARDSVLERFVALHVIHRDDPRADALLEAARRSATILDSRILRVLDAGEEGERCYVVNEWGNGVSLDILVTQGVSLSPRRAAWLVAELAGALVAAHAGGVAHGRLNPENVLIDAFGSVRIIGLCVDAALHGLPEGTLEQDREDLAGLLYCALTTQWPGPSGSIVPAAPRENGQFLSPRQVRAGVPKPLDALWREFNDDKFRARGAHQHPFGQHHPDVSSAHSIARELLDFVGDPAGMPEALAQAVPEVVNPLRPVWLPAVEDPLPNDSSMDDIPVVPPLAHDERDERREQEQRDRTAERPDRPERPEAAAAEPPRAVDVSVDEPPAPEELPTEAGMPVFGDDEVQWLTTRRTPPPPPPPFEELPERPLFAPDNGTRRGMDHLNHPLRHLADAESGESKEYWPWENGQDEDRPVALDDSFADDKVPGRSWLRLAMAVALALAIFVAVAIAFNLGRGRTPLGEEKPSEEASSPVAAAPLTGLKARAFDPLGDDGDEHDAEAPLAVDGNTATAWTTDTYFDQLGATPPSLKPGVGLVIDLGEDRTIDGVEVQVLGGATSASLYAYDAAPEDAPEGPPRAKASGESTLNFALAAAADREETTGRYLVLWLTSLPEAGEDFRAQIAEVVVHGR